MGAHYKTLLSEITEIFACVDIIIKPMVDNKLDHYLPMLVIDKYHNTGFQNFYLLEDNTIFAVGIFDDDEGKKKLHIATIKSFYADEELIKKVEFSYIHDCHKVKKSIYADYGLVVELNNV